LDVNRIRGVSLVIDRKHGRANNGRMLPLLIAMILYLFMLVGALVFTISVAIPPIRRYALSAALWCLMCGPCIVAALVLAGTAATTASFVTKNGDLFRLHPPRLLSTIGLAYTVVSLLITAGVATATAWLHQAILHRLTFALFRLYVTVVCAGIGSVFGWALGFLLMWREVKPVLPIWIPGMLVLVIGFGALGCWISRNLRGQQPSTFTWVTPDEFYGPNHHPNLN
jgi:hypothetical protein